MCFSQFILVVFKILSSALISFTGLLPMRITKQWKNSFKTKMYSFSIQGWGFAWSPWLNLGFLLMSWKYVFGDFLLRIIEIIDNLHRSVDRYGFKIYVITIILLHFVQVTYSTVPLLTRTSMVNAPFFEVI